MSKLLRAAGVLTTTCASLSLSCAAERSSPTINVGVLAPPTRGARLEEPQRVSRPREVSTVEHLLGCWKDPQQSARWHFTRSPEGAIEGMRELNGENSSYARRARIATTVRHDAATNTAAFFSAGPIHALMFLLNTTQAESIEVWAYSSHIPDAGYHWTGGHFFLQRCA